MAGIKQRLMKLFAKFWAWASYVEPWRQVPDEYGMYQKPDGEIRYVSKKGREEWEENDRKQW
ncbi:hypothetical protein GO988_11425 [Hymenobacter sp. HMF4947]|uniref:Uncharacterized protein n=1 Tax=Hymenobacter ginkgonis TaxID=2682976 RepID=A0A7K1TEW6_9BACT|nr:hypothetical protein [Hymenobacter ginkgonis]MVN76935.1 hypothetical protein [Hymenobacter ginkgonis]